MNENQIKTAVSLDELPKITEYVEGYLSERDASLGTIMKMNIAIDEIFSNIVKFSGATYASVTCCTEGDSVRLIFEDDGIKYDPLKKEDADITLSAEDRKIGGLGILMVKKSMDNMEYEYKDSKNILILTKKL